MAEVGGSEPQTRGGEGLGGRLQGTWSALPRCCLPWTSGKARHSGNEHWGAQPGVDTSPHPSPHPCGTWLVFPCPSACHAGAAKSSCGFGAELAGFALQPQASFQLFACCGITTGNWREALEGHCRGFWRGLERGVLALMDCLTSLGSPARVHALMTAPDLPFPSQLIMALPTELPKSEVRK